MSKEKIIDIDSVTGSPLRCVLIKSKPFNKNNFVEFYDQRVPQTTHGQFIARYYLSTLLGFEGETGLIIDPASDDWQIDKEAIHIILSWLKYHSFQHAQNRKEVYG